MKPVLRSRHFQPEESKISDWNICLLLPVSEVLSAIGYFWYIIFHGLHRSLPIGHTNYKKNPGKQQGFLGFVVPPTFSVDN